MATLATLTQKYVLLHLPQIERLGMKPHALLTPIRLKTQMPRSLSGLACGLARENANIHLKSSRAWAYIYA